MLKGGVGVSVTGRDREAILTVEEVINDLMCLRDDLGETMARARLSDCVEQLKYAVTNMRPFVEGTVTPLPSSRVERTSAWCADRQSTQSTTSSWI